MTTVLLDNEAVQALRDPRHPKHRAVLAHLDGVVQRRRRGKVTLLRIPTAVRAEAGWDRSDPAAATINRLRIEDVHLHTRASDAAARHVKAFGVSVADAHLGAAMEQVTTAGDDVVVLTSDVHDMTRLAPPLGVRIVRI